MICFAVSAVLIPVAAHLPHWVEFELVLAAWWVVWVIALSWLLVNAHFVSHDASPGKVGMGSGASGCLLPDVVMDGCLLGSGCSDFRVTDFGVGDAAGEPRFKDDSLDLRYPTHTFCALCATNLAGQKISLFSMCFATISLPATWSNLTRLWILWPRTRVT